MTTTTRNTVLPFEKATSGDNTPVTGKALPEPFSGRRYQENTDRCPGGSTPCALCGKAVLDASNPPLVRVIDGGARFAPVAMPESEIDTAGDMGWWPVGPECRRRFPKAYVR